MGHAKTAAKVGSKIPAMTERNKPQSKPKSALLPKIEKLGRVSTKSVLKCTGKNWDQWLKILNDAGADTWQHKELVAFLKGKYKLSPWWQQGVASGYEIAIGRRVEGRNLKGEYSLTATKSIHVAAKSLWKFLCSPEGLALWLRPLSEVDVKAGTVFEAEGCVFGEFRTVKPGSHLRMTWQETDWDRSTTVLVSVIPRPAAVTGPRATKSGRSTPSESQNASSSGKSILVIQHERIHDGRIQIQMRQHWKDVLERIAKLSGSYTTST